MSNVMNGFLFLFLVPLFLIPALSIGGLTFLTQSEDTSLNRRKLETIASYIILIGGAISFLYSYYMISSLLTNIVFLGVSASELVTVSTDERIVDELFWRAFNLPLFSEWCYTEDIICQAIEADWWGLAPIIGLVSGRMFLVRLLVALAVSWAGGSITWYLSRAVLKTS